ncbi:MAG: pilus assembly protein PilM, partial [Burkholderiaceae bacterium]
AQQPDSVDVLLVAARQETIHERAELALAIGLKPHIVDLESQALMAAVRAMLRLNDAQAEHLLGVIHIDAEQGCIYFIQGESILFEFNCRSNRIDSP